MAGAVSIQPDLFSAPPSHRADPDTSRIAAVITAASAGALRDRILLHLLRVGDFGTTAYEAWKACGGKYPHVAGTRLGELAAPKDGVPLVEQTDRRRPTDTGNPSVVWVLTRAGQARAVELRLAS